MVQQVRALVVNDAQVRPGRAEDFFVSSRRQHTRYWRDWSSDVCSSDLVGEKHGTMGVLDAEGGMHEVTTFRRDVETDGRHAVVAFGASLDEDLARRDFTINAIAYSPSRRVLHDPFGGRADLAARVVRAVGDPDERMREDRLRALRAIRFAARFDFDIDPGTWRAVVASAQHLTRLSAERVKE